MLSVQQWHAEGHIVILKIPGRVNPADSLTKATPWNLFGPQLRHAMGHYELPAVSGRGTTKAEPTLVVGEGVRACERERGIT